MEIILTEDWLGNKAGTKLDLKEHFAKELINRGTAEIPKKPGRPSKPKDNE